ncbi:MAG: N-formylglutamate amidohydrolase [Erythrobacter sp.]|nr:MAG: N-formylglutamate amidohydrolase [Erythrobacter sp.]
MTAIETARSDSPERGGGLIPGSEGLAAFSLIRRRAMAIPVLIAVPHAGREYPPALLRRLRHPDDAPHRLEDRLVDLVGHAVARDTGAALLVAHAPRAMIDLNRSPDDVDWEMVAGGGSKIRSRLAVGRRARGGLGLVPRRLPGLGELWIAPLPRAELSERIETIHQPYHTILSQTLETMRDRWGAALLVDLHSMPPLGPKTGDDPAVDYVIGDRFGGSCDNRLVLAGFDHLEKSGARAAHNQPYAGGYVLDRHGAPGRGISALQLEVCRTAYLDRDMRHPGPGLDDVVQTVTGLVRRFADELAGSATGLAEAAE